jgi:hypothetical protein
VPPSTLLPLLLVAAHAAALAAASRPAAVATELLVTDSRSRVQTWRMLSTYVSYSTLLHHTLTQTTPELPWKHT